MGFYSTGTGKSEVTRCLLACLDAFCAAIGEPKCYVTCAMYGNAAKNINGGTVASTFAITKAHGTRKMKPENAAKYASDFKHVKAVFLDEISCCDQRHMYMIDSRLRQFLGRSAVPFGGAVVVAVGDFFQLPPIGGTPLYLAAGKSGCRNIDDFNTFDIRVQHRSDNQSHADDLEALRHRHPGAAWRRIIKKLRKRGMPKCVGADCAALVATRVELRVLAEARVLKYAAHEKVPVLRLDFGDGCIPSATKCSLRLGCR